MNPTLNKNMTLAYLETVERPGMDKLIEYLNESDFFSAPASTHHHDACIGGLCKHSLSVMSDFDKANSAMEHPLPNASVIITGVLHDACKINTYIPSSIGYTTMKVDGKATTKHATISIERINKFITLTPQEEDIIRYHMGLFGIYTYREYDTLKLHKAIMKTPQVQIFAAIDMLDSKRSM